MANRIRRCKNSRELEQLIDDFITTGYEIKSRGENNALLIKKGKHSKHFLVFLLTFWFTMGIGNLIYALIPVKNQDEIMLKVDESLNEDMTYHKE